MAEGTVSDDLAVLFRKYGAVTECAVMGNYGFVHMATESEAKAAIADLDGYSVKGSHIHVELSTASTQGRKKRSMDRDGGRFEPYPAARHDSHYRSAGPAVGLPPDRGTSDRPAAREEYASEQVKDLLELYFRDPVAFDQYAKTYYYGERAERERAAARTYYDRRIPEADYAKPSSYVGVADAAVYSSRSLPSVGSSSMRDDRYRGAYGGRI